MKNKQTIFFLINSMENGGAEKVLSNILPPLSEDYNIFLILLKNKIFYPLPSNITIVSLSNIRHNLLMLFLFPVYTLKLKKLIKKYKPTKIISSLEISNFVNILINKQAIISFETSLFFFQNSFIGKIYKKCILKLYPKAQIIKVNSQENRLDLATKTSIPLRKIITIYNPINTEEISRLQNKKVILPFTLRKNHKIFVTVGRLNALKNTTALIQSFKKLPENNILLIIGDGPEKNNLKRLITRNQLQKQIFLLGRQKNVYKYLNIAHYFIFASMVEGFPNVLAEAMACNLPIITSDFKTGAREIIDPGLKFNKKIKYPYYGPNGVLLSLNNFKQDFLKVNFKKTKQKQINLNKFELQKITSQWKNILK